MRVCPVTGCVFCTKTRGCFPAGNHQGCQVCHFPPLSANAMPHQPMDPEERLANWESERGFLGVKQSRTIYRKCECGRPTTCLADAQCRMCMGMVRINQRFECRKDACSGHARKGWGMLCRPCWVAEDPERAARVLREWEEEKGFAGVFYSSHIARKCAITPPYPQCPRPPHPQHA